MGKGQQEWVHARLLVDTEEATYVWHLQKDRDRLRDFLLAVDKDLATIRNEGRQAFLEIAPNNFSRIMHNYSDERKGFVVWRDILEERLV